MAFASRLPKVRYHSKHFNKRTWMCYHQAPPLVRVVAHVGDAGQARPHLEHNPLSLLGTCHATPIRKLNDPESTAIAVGARFYHRRMLSWVAGREHTLNRLKCKLPQSPSKVKRVWFVHGTACAWNPGMINCPCTALSTVGCLSTEQNKHNTLGSMWVVCGPIFYHVTHYR